MNSRIKSVGKVYSEKPASQHNQAEEEGDYLHSKSYWEKIKKEGRFIPLRLGLVARHTSGAEGMFCKRYRPTGSDCYYIMINTFDGRRFCAPESEWDLFG